MTEAERHVIEAAIRLVALEKAAHCIWPVEAVHRVASLVNTVNALEAPRDLSRYHSGWAERMARGEDWHPACRTWHRPENCPEGQNPPGESAPKGRREGAQ